MLHWNIKKHTHKTSGLQENVHPIVLKLLAQRGITRPDSIQEFLNPNWNDHVHDPAIFAHMEKTVERIFKAIETGEHVTIFGDYDADGTCGTTILYTTFKRLGMQNVDYYIPHRQREGYGMNKEAVKKISEKGTTLIITVDLGISNVEEIAYANELGMEVIIIDHHEFQEENGNIVLPPAYAIVHTRIPGETYPCKHLSGAGTAFKVAQALLSHSLEDNEGFEKWLLDVVAIATVADIVPLIEENRTLVKYGLMVLGKTRRPGLRKLIELAGIKTKGFGPSLVFDVDSWSIGFQIAPRINAAGRMQHANEAVKMLLSEQDHEAERLANILSDLNKERQKVGEHMYKEAEAQVKEKEDSPVLIVYKQDWPMGLVGLVAGKLSNEHYKPVIALTDAEGMIAGSGRSVEGVDIIEMLTKVRDDLERFGGHSAACGLKLKPEQLESFKENFTACIKEELKNIDLKPTLHIDSVLTFSEITSELVKGIMSLEPFGEANEEPVFLTRVARVETLSTVGTQQQHLRLTLTDATDRSGIGAIGFRLGTQWRETLQVNDLVDIVYTLGFNEWNGSKSIQLVLKDLKKSD